MSVPVLCLGADLERVSPLTILDDPFNSKRMQRGMLRFLNREWTRISAEVPFDVTEVVVELAISPEGATSLPVASATGLAM